MRYFLLTILLITANLIFANPPDTLDHFPNYRMQGGNYVFFQFIEENLRYPQPARQSGVTGTAIVSVTLEPTGAISVTVVNSLGNSIDNELTTTFQETQFMWLPDSYESHDLIFFLPVTFLINDFKFARNNHTAGFLLEEIFVTTQSLGEGNQVPEPDHKLAEKAITFYHEKKYRRALKPLNELIRRNPFNEELYKMRGYCRYATNNRLGACEDYQKIQTCYIDQFPQ